MRLLLCQTPKLTYVQAIELLQREVEGHGFDLVLLPEMAIEHPPQCTDQGTLTFQNVALMMLSRFAKANRIYLVLGSVEERDPETGVHDTCIVLGREGEFLLKYRKQALNPLAKTAGADSGVFETDHGPVGLLLGAEAEEETRWAPILARKPCVVLNPTRAPMQMDPLLARTHPELQTAAWLQGFRRLERHVEVMTRSYACPFARADAPHQGGGAGTSILVELHRSIVAPSWGPAFMAVETTRPSDMEGQKMPGWRLLTVDERIQAAARDPALLLHEDISQGPRYVVWTLPHPLTQAQVLYRSNWSCQAAQDMVGHFDAASKFRPKESFFLAPLKARDGRPLYVVVTSGGSIAMWDARLKRTYGSCSLKEVRVTAVGCSQKDQSQFIVAGTTPACLTFRVIDERSVLPGVLINKEDLPWGQWPSASALAAEKLRSLGCHSREAGGGSSGDADPPPRRAPSAAPSVASAVPTPTPGEHSLKVKFVFHVDMHLAVAVVEAMNSDLVPLGLLIHLDSGAVEALDIYGSGPPLPEEQGGGSSAEDRHSESLQQPEEALREAASPTPVSVKAPTPLADVPEVPPDVQVDQLVGAQVIEQRFHERPGKRQHAMVCLYRSNRICVATFGDWELHKMMLLEESATERQRADVPLCCTAMANAQSSSYHIIVSYSSMVVRWWQASLTQCRMQSHLSLASPATQISVFEWCAGGSPAPSDSPSPDDPRAGRRGIRRSSRSPNRSPSPRQDTGGARRSISARRSLLPLASRAALADELHVGAQLSERGARGDRAAQPRASLLERGAAAADGVLLPGRTRGSIIDRGKLAVDIDPATPTIPTVDYGYISTKFLICAADDEGCLRILLAHGGRIQHVYSCVDLCLPKGVRVGAIWCMEKSIAVLLSSGDVRYFEFRSEEEVISPTDILAGCDDEIGASNPRLRVPTST